MRREDLFIAIGKVEEERLAWCDKYMAQSDWEGAKMNKGGKYASCRSVKKYWLIAAIIALMVLLMGSAIGKLITVRVEKVKTSAQVKETRQEETVIVEEVHAGEKVDFEKEHDVYIELEPYYPQHIPEGYAMTFISDGAPLNSQRVVFENEDGFSIDYTIYVADSASSVEIYDILNKTEVDILGLDGILYEQVGNQRTLVWSNVVLGYGFVLRTNDGAVDLLAMATSTVKGAPLTPTRSESTVKALEELGDLSPTHLPEGYEENGVLGASLEEGSGWYAYVRKWYTNKTENTQIYFEYETYRIITEDGYTDDARTACSFFIPGYHILKGEVVGEETLINGMFGIMTETDIAWADPETHRVYHLHSENVVGEALLQVAQSIYDKD